LTNEKMFVILKSNLTYASPRVSTPKSKFDSCYNQPLLN
jgi:hypothetical protein